MELAYPFSTSERPELAQVGGKAMSLILTTQQGFPVPAGFVLSVAFFQPWLERIQQSPEWAAALDSSSEDLKRKTMRVEGLCADLELDDLRREVLAQSLAVLEAGNGPASYAVRSSSPEEDLEGLSFAGGYETVLGVKKEKLEDALRRSFASCFDERVFVYKQEHGLPVDKPRIAVIVQRQIAADTAGVAFSLNPINNCYDEAVINANFGIGESVVAGRVSPDTFVVDKVTRTILDRKIGAKETSVWLDAEGGTYEEPSSSRGELCLSNEQALRLTDMLGRVEGYYERPIDIEWAFADGRLHLLQARPITAYFPLPEIMLTAPGKPKRLYNDVTLTKWGMQEPLSVMGMDFMEIANAATLRFSMGENTTSEAIAEMRVTVQGRTYGNLSNALRLEGKKRFLGAFRAIDVLSAEAVANMDDAEYIPKKLPPAMRGILFSALRQNLGTIVNGLRALKDPAQCRQKYLDDVERCMEDLEALWQEELTMREFAERTVGIMVATVSAFMSVLFAAEIARSRIKKLFKDEETGLRDKVVYLERALPDNVTIEMGLAMYRLASFSEVSECTSGTEFAARLLDGSFSPEFLDAWDGFMAAYGFRGPMEMDPAASRFYEQPELFFGQLRTMAESATPDSSPVAIFERAKAQREEAYKDLLRAVRKRGKRKARQFESLYEVLMTLGGSRETPKYHFVLIADKFRRRVMEAARLLAEAGRLDIPEQVFDLTMDQLDDAIGNASIDLKALAEENTEYLRRLRHIREFPRIIDSRGRILRPPRRKAGEGELVGEPISPGVVRGKINVLREPDEKPVLPGEILVARATDPGWTPLFLNASGIILEIGGLLQHGALVAREYGKPCVAGIEHATSVLSDGQMVELDGASGVVRFI